MEYVRTDVKGRLTQMMLNEIMEIAAECYPDRSIESYWDPAQQRVYGGADCGDTLALFIVRELRDTYDAELPSEEQIEEAIRVMDRAREDIKGVIDGLQVCLDDTIVAKR